MLFLYDRVEWPLLPASKTGDKKEHDLETLLIELKNKMAEKDKAEVSEPEEKRCKVGDVFHSWVVVELIWYVL